MLKDVSSSIINIFKNIFMKNSNDFDKAIDIINKYILNIVKCSNSFVTKNWYDEEHTFFLSKVQDYNLSQ